MNIQFDSEISKSEAQGIILLLQSLYPALNNFNPVSPSVPPVTLQTAIDSTTDAPGLPAEQTTQAGPSLVQEPPTRKRRTKAEIAADEAAKAEPTPAVAVSVESQATAESAKATSASPSADRAPISADELRSGLNSYIARHSMEEAIAILQTFGCNRVSEALALDPQKLNSLVEKLRG